MFAKQRIGVFDFETEPIQRRPDYPPKPVGVSIIKPGETRPHYYAWGHLEGGNNCTFKEAKAALKELYDAECQLLCHNSKFDLDVAEVHMGLRLPGADRIDDTMFLIFLENPHSPNLQLKQSSERLLGMPPDEQDEVKAWILKNKKMLETKYPEIISVHGGIKPSTTGAFIAYAPGDLIGKYADGDTIRTLKLFNKLRPLIHKRKMDVPYRRECTLLSILLRNEREGLRVDLPLLKTDMVKYDAALVQVNKWICSKLKTPSLNIESGDELADALDKCGYAENWVLTRSGKRSTSKENLLLAVSDQEMLHALSYRGKLVTCLQTFMRPWLVQAIATHGRIHTSWNQVRQGGGSSEAGARTGRLSSTPNFMNVPKEVVDGEREYYHPHFIKGLPLLPAMRKYILADEGCVWGKRDYNSQELRMLAHYEDGLLCQKYNENPKLDVHQFAKDLFLEIYRIIIERDDTKTVGFGLIYGMGVGKLARKLKRALSEAKEIKAAYLDIFPGLPDLIKSLKELAKNDEPFRTWGGREYYVEEPHIVDGQMRDFAYKLINYLIQGSSADMTKEALIRYDRARKHGRFAVTVHDELNICVSLKWLKSEMEILRKVMCSIELDVPILADGATGITWGDLRKYED